MDPVRITRGNSPLVLSSPHTGTYVPDDIRAKLNDEGQRLRDTDWHIEKLYAGLIPDATCVQATFHRYVIDANRDPSGKSLYPGQTTTGLVPLTTFDNTPIWREGEEPDATEVARRTAQFHAPYHAALAAELARVKAIHGYAVLYDCHSIRSVIPWLFEGTLPDFNIGTDGGRTCDPRIEAAAHAGTQATRRTEVLNGRFRGGWTTRHYGQPSQGIHAIQMELAQASHLASEEPPFALSEAKCAILRPQLTDILTRILHAAAEAARHAPQH
ncbi:N-formylglutamate deformylase [Salipiger sp. 1_MG-2023]|uniref:N-formylglutamate deformylase n=1 Tax=Salipiger sp. 1_MG-2023 TaxID=3062665 RepID=UPI0026E22E46|nr:N-formylglutamate deformylase [Salipiger sp. 1_MG-2023]MDO6585161.1 N-formylglutamate deformylase [Salipiger sp. 1_MG-2023]